MIVDEMDVFRDDRRGTAAYAAVELLREIRLHGSRMTDILSSDAEEKARTARAIGEMIRFLAAADRIYRDLLGTTPILDAVGGGPSDGRP